MVKRFKVLIMAHKRKKTIVIINNSPLGIGKDYRIVDKDASTSTKLVLASQQSYSTIKDAKKDAKSKGFKISKEW